MTIKKKTALKHPLPLLGILSCFFLLLPSTAIAKKIPNFDAEFKVKVFYFTVGSAYQSFHCQGEECVLRNQAKPPKWAQKYINESVKEQITIRQTEDVFSWQHYTKHLTRTYKDKPSRQIHTELVREEEQIKMVEKPDKFWPAREGAFDIVSFAYALQYAVLNRNSIRDFYIQDDKTQDKFKLKKKFDTEELDLPIEDEIETERFEFRNGKINAELWLAPKWDFFPVQIKVEDKEKDRTITLELSKLKLT